MGVIYHTAIDNDKTVAANFQLDHLPCLVSEPLIIAANAPAGIISRPKMVAEGIIQVMKLPVRTATAPSHGPRITPIRG